MIRPHFRFIPILTSVFFVTSINIPLYKTFVYAEDLPPGLSGKLDPVRFTLDGQKTKAITHVVAAEAPRPVNNSAGLSMKQQDLVADVKLVTQTKERTPVESSQKSWLPWPAKQESKAKEIKIEVDKEMDRIETQQQRDRRRKDEDSNPYWFWPGTHNQKYDDAAAGDRVYKVAIADKKITLRELVDIALANSISLKAAAKRIEAAESRLVEAKRALFPTVQFVKEINGGHVSGRFYKGENHKVNVSQPLFYGGELTFTVKQAEASLESTRAQYRKARADLVQQARTAYYGLLKAEYNQRYQAELYDVVSNLNKRVKEEYKQKLITEIDRLNVESQYQQVFFQVESAKNDLLSADLLLHQTAGLDAGEALPLDLQIHFKKVQPEFRKMVDLALTRNPDLLSKEYALGAAKYAVKIYQAKKVPHFDLRGSYGMLGEQYRDTGFENVENDLEKEWFLGFESSMPVGPNSAEYSITKHQYGPTVLSLTGSDDWRHRIAFNLLDKLSNITDEKSAQAALLEAQGEYDKVRDDAILKIRDDFYNLQKSLIQIDSAEARIQYQDRQNGVLDYMRGLQESSVTSLVEGLITQAQNKFSFIQAVADYELAKSSLSVSIGDPDYFEDKS